MLYTIFNPFKVPLLRHIICFFPLISFLMLSTLSCHFWRYPRKHFCNHKQGQIQHHSSCSPPQKYLPGCWQIFWLHEYPVIYRKRKPNTWPYKSSSDPRFDARISATVSVSLQHNKTTQCYEVEHWQMEKMSSKCQPMWEEYSPPLHHTHQHIIGSHTPKAHKHEVE